MKDKIEMTASQRKEVKELVKGSCANYDRSTGECLLMDVACYQACNFTGLCRYFKEAVLPANKPQMNVNAGLLAWTFRLKKALYLRCFQPSK